MAEALLLGAMTSLMQELVMKLCTRLRGVKGTDAESQELHEFIDLLKRNSSLCMSSDPVRQELQQILDEAESKLDKWSSKKSRFLARSSSERMRVLQAQRWSVENAIRVANLRLSDDINIKVDRMELLIRHNSEPGRTQNPAQNPAQDPAQNLAQDIAQDPAQNLPHGDETFYESKDIKYKMEVSHQRKGEIITDDIKMSLRTTTDQIKHDRADSHQMEEDKINDDKADSNMKKEGKAMGKGQRVLNLLQDPFQLLHNKPQPNVPTNMASHGSGETVTTRSTNFSATTVMVTHKPSPATHSMTTLASSGGNDPAHSTGQQQPCTSTHGGHKRPASSLEESSITSPPSFAAMAESVLETHGLTGPNKKKRKMHAWLELKVSIDTKKQAKRMKERLFGMKGVKEVHIDQSSQKVSVLLHEGSNVNTTTLLENAQLK